MAIKVTLSLHGPVQDPTCASFCSSCFETEVKQLYLELTFISLYLFSNVNETVCFIEKVTRPEATGGLVYFRTLLDWEAAAKELEIRTQGKRLLASSKTPL